jgi:hypothetical protein
MRSAPQDASLVDLPNGEVLVLDGGSGPGHSPVAPQLFNPGTNGFEKTSFSPPDDWAAFAVSLPNGRVLVLGGLASSSQDGPSTPSAQIYDPATGSTKSAAAPPCLTRVGASLANGRVMLVCSAGAEAKVVLYDPVGDAFVAGPVLVTPRAGALVVRLADGRVLVLGGRGPNKGDTPGPVLSSVEIYQP